MTLVPLPEGADMPSIRGEEQGRLLAEMWADLFKHLSTLGVAGAAGLLVLVEVGAAQGGGSIWLSLSMLALGPMVAPNDLPPRRFETRRLLVRQARPEEVHLLRAAVDSSLEHLQAWMPWAMNEPRSVEMTREHLARKVEEFDRGEDFSYNMFTLDETEIVGGIGFHPRSAPDCLEMGYWVSASREGRGYATEAGRALSRAGLALDHIRAIQIDCDPENRASARVAEKLGYTLVECRVKDKTTPTGEPRDTLVFELASLEDLR